MTKKQTRRIGAARLRKALDGFTQQLCNAQERVAVTLSGNTFEIVLDGATVNITINEAEGGVI